MRAEDHERIYFKLWRFFEFEVSGKEAIRAGKPYMFLGAACLAIVLFFLFWIQSFGMGRITSLLVH